MTFFFESASWDIATLLSVIGAVIYFYLTSTHNFWERLNVPYIKPKIIFGNVKEVMSFKKTHFHLFQEFYNHFKESGQKFGGIFQMRTPVLLICSPELAKDIFVKNFPHFHDRHFVHDEHFDPLSAHLVALEGQKWKFLRSKLSPAFSSSKLKGMFGIVREIADEFMKNLEESEQVVEARKACSLFLVDVIAATAFGLKINAMKEDSEFLHVGQQFFEPTKTDRISQIIFNTYPWLYKILKIQIVPKKVTEFFMGIVKDTMAYRKENNIQKNDFLHFLMKIREEKGTSLGEMEEMKGVANYNMKINENAIELTEGVIAAQAFVFFLAGYETSASALSSCIHVLADHPEIQEKILQEVDAAILKFGDLSYDAVQELVYVEQVLEEALRMYPPIGLIVRKCTKPYQIPDTSVVIPKGCQVFIPIYAFHYDPELFPDPTEFKPERFSPEQKKNIVPYSYMPFGHGPRVCIGSRLAMMEMKLSLSLLIKNFKISRCEKTTPYKIHLKGFFMAPTNGLWVRLTKRNEKLWQPKEK